MIFLYGRKFTKYDKFYKEEIVKKFIEMCGLKYNSEKKGELNSIKISRNELDKIAMKYGFDKSKFNENEFISQMLSIKFIENKFLGEDYIKSKFTKDCFNEINVNNSIFRKNEKW